MIYRRPLFWEIFSLSIIISFLHYSALVLFLYWTVSWFDSMMHFLGGLLIGLIISFIFYIYEWEAFPKNNKVQVLIITLGGVLVIGLTWELWELFVGFTDIVKDQTDTLLDIIMDLIGGGMAFLYAKKYLWQ